MLDATPKNDVHIPGAPTLARGDIVLFQYPTDRNDADACYRGYRPCLVTDIFDNPAGQLVELCCGSAKIATGLPNQLLLNARASLQALGVYVPQRFDLNTRISVSMRHPGFMTQDDSNAPIVIGRLARRDVDRMNAIRAKLMALRDIASERRREAATRARPRDNGQ